MGKRTLAITVFLFFCVPVVAQPSTDGPEIIRLKALQDDEKDSPLKKLQRRNFKEALAETQLSYQLFLQKVLRDPPIEAGRRLQKAGVEFYGRGKQCSSFLRDMIEFADFLEKSLNLKTARNSGVPSKQILQLELHKVRQFRLDLEIQLLKLETGVK